MTTAERVVLMINQLTAYKPKSRQEKFKRELINLILADERYTQDEKAAVREELAKMSEK